MVDLARQIWRDYEVDGVAASGKHKPKKSKLRQWGTWVEGIITSLGQDSYTAAQIAAAANFVNTTAKFDGKLVWDRTNNRMMRASGTTAVAPWHVIDGSATVTPA